MVAIKGGKFTPAGSDKEVEVKNYYIGKTEMTWEVLDIFAFSLDLSEAEKAKDDEWNNVDKTKRARPSKPYGAPDHGFGHQGFAALSMTYKSADKFCAWLSQKTGHKYRLPTEAEWEYAARAGGPAGPIDPAALQKIAWTKDEADDMMHPVGLKAPNAWGLLDILGNGCEWCVGNDGQPCARGGSWSTPVKKLATAGYGIREVQNEKWNSTDPQDPKSSWWLSDGKFVTFRVVRDE
jgi:formylglycine-generating enzyme required for sulfatase activity